MTPSRTVMLSVKPIVASSQNVPASENGMPILTRPARRLPRNSHEIRNTRASPVSALFCMMLIDCRVGTV